MGVAPGRQLHRIRPDRAGADHRGPSHRLRGPRRGVPPAAAPHARARHAARGDGGDEPLLPVSGAAADGRAQRMRTRSLAQIQSETSTRRKMTRMQVAVSWYLNSFMVLISENPSPPAPTSPSTVADRMLTSKR